MARMVVGKKKSRDSEESRVLLVFQKSLKTLVNTGFLSDCDGTLLQSLLWGKSGYPPGYGVKIFSKFCLYLFLTCVFAGMHVGFGGVHAGIYLCLN